MTDTSTTAAPTGSVQFVVDGVNFGSPVTLTAAGNNRGSASSAATTTLSVAGSSHSVTANYVNTDGNFSDSSGTPAGGQTVNAVTPSFGGLSASQTVAYGHSAHSPGACR